MTLHDFTTDHDPNEFLDDPNGHQRAPSRVNAGPTTPFKPLDTLCRVHDRNYENPVLTATSRSVIADIHTLSRQLSAIDVPRPVALLCTLLRLKPPQTGFLARRINEPLFQALRVWTDIGDVCENESFDGHRKTIVEHTLNVLILPGIHREGRYRGQPATESPLLTNSSAPISPVTPSSHSIALPPTTSYAHPHLTAPALSIPGTALTIPSPFHLQLRIITRLSFNEQGHITHHRDFWDVKDVLGLVPGVSLAQWVATRLAARSVGWVVRSGWLGFPSSPSTPEQEEERMEKGMSVPATSTTRGT
uniref:SnoaL-like domain-containing protein n=1 Tax=Mycena chlorophos TaxID=658473 RepID=A0ABQ0L5S5_MYCCL|nr:predicted protein [Mycena chlorophos]